MNAFIIDKFDDLRRRYKGGQVKPPQSVREKLEQTEKELRLIETKQVVAQPHRGGQWQKSPDGSWKAVGGDGGDMAGAELGKFIQKEFADSKEDYRRAIYTSCNSFYYLTIKWRRKVGIPPPLRSTYWHFDTLPDCPQIIEVDASSQEVLTDEEMEKKVRDWRRLIDEWQTEMQRAGMGSFAAAKDLILDDKKPHPQNVGWVRRCLQNLAKAQGWD